MMNTRYEMLDVWTTSTNGDLIDFKLDFMGLTWWMKGFYSHGSILKMDFTYVGKTWNSHLQMDDDWG